MSEELNNTVSEETVTEGTAVEEVSKDQEPTETEKLRKKIKRSEKSVKRYQFFILRLLLLVLVIWVLLFKVIGLTRMPNDNMYPRIDAGDLMLFYRLDKNVRAQDIVVLETETPNSEGQKKTYILRVVAVAGDTVEVTNNGNLVINGNSVVENGIFYSTIPYEGFTSYPITLGEDEVFVLADKRNGGEDSRYFGPVKKSELVGTVITILRRNNL